MLGGACKLKFPVAILSQSRIFCGGIRLEQEGRDEVKRAEERGMYIERKRERERVSSLFSVQKHLYYICTQLWRML